MSEPSFPPLMSGLAVVGRTDPFDTACAKAEAGCDAGLVVYNLAADRLGAASSTAMSGSTTTNG